jgi:hypothetical protein
MVKRRKTKEYSSDSNEGVWMRVRKEEKSLHWDGGHGYLNTGGARTFAPIRENIVQE